MTFRSRVAISSIASADKVNNFVLGEEQAWLGISGGSCLGPISQDASKIRGNNVHKFRGNWHFVKLKCVMDPCFFLGSF